MTSERPDPSRPEEPEPKLDIEAAFAEIVAHWAPPPPEADEARDVEEAPPAPAPAGGGATPPAAPKGQGDPERLRGLFQPSWNDPLDDEGGWADEGHFVPPPP